MASNKASLSKDRGIKDASKSTLKINIKKVKEDIVTTFANLKDLSADLRKGQAG